MVSCKANYSKLLFVLLLVLLCAPIASASVNVSFADPDATVHKDVMIYNGTGTLLGTYNTTTNGIPLPEEDVIFIIKPQYSNPADDPVNFLAGVIGWVETNAMLLMIFGLMGVFLFKRF